MLPFQFERLLFDIRDFLKVNEKRVTKYDVIREEELPEGIKVLTQATLSKKRAMVHGRINLETRFHFQNEHLFIGSGRDNDHQR